MLSSRISALDNALAGDGPESLLTCTDEEIQAVVNDSVSSTLVFRGRSHSTLTRRILPRCGRCAIHTLTTSCPRRYPSKLIFKRPNGKDSKTQLSQQCFDFGGFFFSGGTLTVKAWQIRRLAYPCVLVCRSTIAT